MKVGKLLYCLKTRSRFYWTQRALRQQAPQEFNVMKKLAFWLSLIASVLWIGVGLRDLFAPSLFSFSGRVASNSTVILDFATGAIFLLVVFSLGKAKNQRP